MAYSNRPTVWIEGYKNSNGEKFYRVRYEVDGKRGPSTNCGPHKELAKQVEARLKRDLWAGRLGIEAVVLTSKSWSDLAKEYEDHCHKNKRPNTWLGFDRPMLKSFGAFIGPKTPLRAISSESVLKWKNHMQEEEGLSDTTVAGRLRQLRACFTYAVKTLKWLSENPATSVPLPQTADRERLPSDAELGKLLVAAKPRLARLIRLALGNGQRSGVLVNVDNRQINRSRLTLLVTRHSRLGIKTGHQPKVGTRTVLIPIPPKHVALYGPHKAEGPAFPEYTGTPKEKVNQVAKDMREAVKAAGIHDLHFHDLKHVFCTRYLEHGGRIEVLSDITGTSITTLKKSYIHLSNKVAAEEMSRVKYKF